MPAPWKLSPSDLTFLWDECRLCFYLKVTGRLDRPRQPFPSIFTRIDGLMKSYFSDRSTMDFSPTLPPGRVAYSGKSVQSKLIEFKGTPARSFISGKFDTVVAFEDRSFGVVDFKTSEPKPEHINFYGRQLHAYAHALENPEPGKFGLSPVSRLGLFVVQPTAMSRMENGRLAYSGDVAWMEIPRDEAAFLNFIGEVTSLLADPVPPPPGEDCSYCAYRLASRLSGY